MLDVSGFGPPTPVSERTLPATLNRGLQRQPDKLALVDDHTRLTYADIWTQGHGVAGGLRRLGVQRQEPVAVMLDNHVDHALAWFGTGCMAAIEVPVHTAFKGSMLSYVLNDCGARVAIVEDRYCERFAAVADLQTLETIVVRGGTGSALPPGRFRVESFEDLMDGDPAEPTPVGPHDLAAIMYTSGTTGPSKGVMVTQAQSYMRLPPEQCGMAQADDVVFVTLPLFHVVAQSCSVHNALIAGATSVILDGFHVSTFWQDVHRHGATLTTLLGAMANFLFQQPPRPEEADNPLRGIVMVPLLPEVEKFKQRFGVEICSSYGLTEATSPLVVPFGGPLVPRGCGWVRPDYEARVVDADDLDVGVDQVGELLLRAKDPWSIMAGYWNKPEATVAAWRNLWLHTGDLFTRDEDGQLFFVDRRKDAIRRRGENVSSYEVEAEINRHPAVLESAVVGVPSPDGEQEIKAVVALKPGATLTEEELLTYLAERLPYFMVPRFLRLVEEVPKTPTQKINKVPLVSEDIALAWDREAYGLVVRRDGLVRR